MASAETRFLSSFTSFAIILSVITSAAACRRPWSGPVRIMDGIAETDARSPFMDGEMPGVLKAIRAGSEPSVPAGGERGRAAVLFRKLSRGGSTFDAVLAPPATELSRRLSLPRNARLEFGCGVLPVSRRARGQVRFSIAVESGGRNTPVFERVLTFPPFPGVPPQLPLETVDLSRFGSRKVRLVFRTETDSPRAFRLPGAAMAYWFNPIVLGAAAPQGMPPNVVLVSLDTLRSDHLGCYGYPRPVSPRLDALAADAVRFAVAISPSNWTLPSHMSLLTGVLPAGHGVSSKGQVSRRRLLAQRLRERGFATGAFTAAGFVSGALGFDAGFDFYAEDRLSMNRLDAPEIQARQALGWLERSAGRPFFLFLHSYHPHNPYSSPPAFGTKFTAPDASWTRLNLGEKLGREGFYRPLSERERANVVDLYDGDIACADANLMGPLVDGLKRLGLYDRTLIIVTSDHGESFYEHGSWFHGVNFYDEVLRVPLIVKLPGGTGRGRVIETPVPIIDTVPTVLDVLGIPVGPEGLDGRSLLPLVDGRGRERREIFSEKYMQPPAIVPFPNADPGLHTVAIYDFPYKLVFCVHRPGDWTKYSPPPPPAPPVEVHLFNLGTDPRETANLADREPQVARKLVERIKAFYAAAPAPRPRTKRSRDDARLTEHLKTLGYVDQRP